jgi:hypothetical protein
MNYFGILGVTSAMTKGEESLKILRFLLWRFYDRHDLGTLKLLWGEISLQSDPIICLVAVSGDPHCSKSEPSSIVLLSSLKDK